MKLLAHILGLLRCGLQPRLGTGLGFVCLFDLLVQAIFVQYESTRSFIRGEAGLNLRVQLLPRVLRPFLSDEDLLSHLHRSNGEIIKTKMIDR